MIRRIRLLVLLARPAVIVLLGLYAATGLAQAGQGENRLLLAEALLVVVAFLLFSVVVNDLADEAVDRVNLPGDPRRALATGTAARREFVVIAVTAATAALAGSLLLHRAAVLVVAAGLALSAGYSLRPVRIAERGALASLVLPAGYVAVPYLVGVLAVRDSVRAGDLVLLGGLYVGFIGRIVLKDFRDVRGDALFGKRTFLVRHGRRWTCVLSAACWIAGSLTLLEVRGLTRALAATWAAYLMAALWLLRDLSVERGARRDEALISAIAVVGRGMIITLLAHFSMTGAHWPAPAYLGVMAALAAITLAQASTMARHGPVTRLTVPADLVAEGAQAPAAHEARTHAPASRVG
jgi:4-hydroxybenzoate polyprenyltransferase